MAPTDFPSETFAATRPHRPNVMATRHAVAGGHPWTVQAGFEILEAGGNAFDAGVAMGIATNVLESQFTSFSGVAPSLLYSAERREVVALSGVGVWPKAASVAYFRDNHEGRIEGIWNAIVPGAPDTWLTVLDELGTMSFADVAGGAIRFAREGFPMYPFMAHIIESSVENFRRWPSNAAIYLPQGRPPGVGEMFVQADLGATLQYLADEESAHRNDGRKAGIAAARQAFYAGDVATRFARFHADNGGLLTRDDMAGFRMRAEPPSRIRTRGIDVYAGGPYCQGPSMLQALAILDGFELAAMGHNSADYAHTIIEAIKLVAADREACFGDPYVLDVPLEGLLSEDYAAERRAMIRPGEAWPDMPPAGAVAGRAWPTTGDAAAGLRGAAAQAMSGEAALSNTSYFCVIDRDGNMFSSTPSDGQGQGPVVPGTGLVPSTRGLASWTDPDHPNCVAAGKRPRLTMGPALAIAGDEVFMPFGTPGSDVQLQAMLQVFLNVFLFGMDPQTAVEAPRFATYSFPAAFMPHGYDPGAAKAEPGLGQDAFDALSARGHKIAWWEERAWPAGSMCVIHKDLESGVMRVAADPRRSAYAAGW